MMSVDDLLATIPALRREDLDTWIAERFVVPPEGTSAPLFDEIECARVRLICTLQYDLEIEPTTVPVVLSLVDQLYETRRRLRSLTAALLSQDENVQAAVLAAIQEPPPPIPTRGL
jgi:chaperone modulatory protein CbpM